MWIAKKIFEIIISVPKAIVTKETQPLPLGLFMHRF